MALNTACFEMSMSRPMRARGLKRSTVFQVLRDLLVAPHAGAWIETFILLAASSPIISRAPCGRVD